MQRHKACKCPGGDLLNQRLASQLIPKRNPARLPKCEAVVPAQEAEARRPPSQEEAAAVVPNQGQPSVEVEVARQSASEARQVRKEEAQKAILPLAFLLL